MYKKFDSSWPNGKAARIIKIVLNDIKVKLIKIAETLRITKESAIVHTFGLVKAVYEVDTARGHCRLKCNT